MERWIGKLAVVTGASSGIGRAISVKLCQEGITVLGLGRNASKLEELAQEVHNLPGKFHQRVCDITQEVQIKECFEYIEKDTDLGPVHILVNAAGVWSLGFICQSNGDLTRQTLETNILGVCNMSREAIILMAKHEIRGQIINMNSVSGHVVPSLRPPVMGVYPATKHAIGAISESLNQEMSFCETGIKVTSLSPGMVNTDFFENSLDAKDVKMYKGRVPPAMRAEDVADAVVYILSTPDSVLVKELIITRNV